MRPTYPSSILGGIDRPKEVHVSENLPVWGARVRRGTHTHGLEYTIVDKVRGAYAGQRGHDV